MCNLFHILGILLPALPSLLPYHYQLFPSPFHRLSPPQGNSKCLFLFVKFGNPHPDINLIFPTSEWPGFIKLWWNFITSCHSLTILCYHNTPNKHNIYKVNTVFVVQKSFTNSPLPPQTELRPACALNFPHPSAPSAKVNSIEGK